MIEKIIELSIRNRFLVLILAAALTVAGVFAMLNTPVDAIPDLSENQVIVFTDWMGRSPREIEDQVTYPLVAQAARAGGRAGGALVERVQLLDDHDHLRGQHRLLLRPAAGDRKAGPGQHISAGAASCLTWLPTPRRWVRSSGTRSKPSPDNKVDPERLWALNKFYIAPQLNAASGVADVAIVGGTPLEYQIDVRPEALRAYGITLGDLYAAVGKSNMPAGGGVIQKNNAEYIVRGVGWIKDKEDIENTVIKEVERHADLRQARWPTCQLGTQFRRSVYEKDGNEVTGGAVLMRHGENPLGGHPARSRSKIQRAAGRAARRACISCRPTTARG